MRIQGAVAVVTGGSLGIGKAICSALLESGAKVSVLDINQEEGTNLQKTFQKKYGEKTALFLKCDVTKANELNSAFEETFKAFGRINVVCNNAGIANEEDWEKCVDLNLNAVIRGTYLGLKYMRMNSASDGVIINVASAAGLFPLAQMPVYSATKTAVVGFTRCFEALSETENIRVTALCPFYTKTPLIEELLRVIPNPEEMKMKLGIDKFGLMTPEYVAQGALKLIKDEHNGGQALYITPFSGTNYFRFKTPGQKSKL